MLPHGRCSVTQRGQAGRWAEQYAWSDVRGDVGRLVSTFGALPVVLANPRFHRHGPHASYVEPTIDDDRQSCRAEAPTVLARRVAIETASGGELLMIPATIRDLRITSSNEAPASSFEDAGHLITDIQSSPTHQLSPCTPRRVRALRPEDARTLLARAHPSSPSSGLSGTPSAST